MVSMMEDARLDALRQLNLLDTGPNESFDRITRMASQIFGLPIAAISLTDQDRQWFKSRIGVEVSQLQRDTAPCAEVAEQTKTLIIRDLAADAYYAHSELAGTGARFYAGAPLVTKEGHGLGSLCVVGPQPRNVTPAEIAALQDLAAMVMSQIELEHAFGRIDPLSSFPNRTQFIDDLSDLARDCPREKRLCVLLDLARPEQVNNIVRVMGAAYVDDVVKEAARSLRVALPAGRTAYHIAATQFVFLADPDVTDEEYIILLGMLLEQHKSVSMAQFITTVAIGVAPFVLGDDTAANVLRFAHGAAQEARDSESGVSLYSLASEDVHQRRFQLLHDFEAALASADQLRLVFQPRIDLISNACVGAEVLLRWNHPTLGNVSPAEFIPVIEQSLHSKSLTSWVIQHALRQLQVWQATDQVIPLAINISAGNLEENDFSHRVESLLTQYGIAPSLIELEVTESAVMQDVNRAREQLRLLKQAGLRIAVDDFGTGYSSLSYLQTLPIDIIKIDQSFIRDIAKGEREAALVRSMIALSQGMGYRVVAEGIEQPAWVEILREMGCEEGQGYYFSRPLDPVAFTVWQNDWDAANTRCIAA